MSAIQLMNSRSAPRSPIPRSFSPRNAKSGTRTPAIFFSGDRFIGSADYADFRRLDCRLFRALSICAICEICGRLSSSDLPVFDEVVWNFLQETRRPLEDVAITAT